MRQLIAFSLVLVIVMATGCSSGALRLDASADGKSVQAAVGDTIFITLESNPSTGFSWAVMGELPAMFEQMGEPVYTPARSARNIVGAGGSLTFKFRVVKAGTAALTLGYLRSFEDNPPERTFRVDVTAQS